MYIDSMFLYQKKTSYCQNSNERHVDLALRKINVQRVKQRA